MLKLNGGEISNDLFPNGELRFTDELTEAIRYGDPLEISLHFESNLDLFRLLLLSKAIDDCGRREEKRLFLPYVPYSRMDRSEKESLFTLRYFADFLNEMKFLQVHIVEPHSDVTPALIRNCFIHWATKDLAQRAMQETKFDEDLGDRLYFPDAGAEKRYSKMFPGIRYLVGSKKRDFEKGTITGIEIHGVSPGEQRRRNIIMVDDLCVYGGTFLGAVDQLKFLGYKSASLVVAHCENAIHQKGLLKEPFFSRVYCTDSIPQAISHPKLFIIEKSFF